MFKDHNTLSFSSPVLSYLKEHKPMHVAVAVSGGADSLSLAHFLKGWSERSPCRLTALVVDHKLRAESTVEAHHVRDLLVRVGIATEILTWDGIKPQAAIQEKAREARYSLLTSWCKANKVNHLFLGHHLDDQLETFLMRLSRGQGLYSLAAMQPVSDWGGIPILRPFLHLPKSSLISYLKKRDIHWVEDPSNHNACFERVRTRAFAQLLVQAGLSYTDFFALMDALRVLRESTDQQSNEGLRGLKKIADTEWVLDPMPQFDGNHVQGHFVRQLLSTVRQQPLDIKAKKVQGFLEKLNGPNSPVVTLGGCKVKRKRDGLHIALETRNLT